MGKERPCNEIYTCSSAKPQLGVGYFARIAYGLKSRYCQLMVGKHGNLSTYPSATNYDDSVTCRRHILYDIASFKDDYLRRDGQAGVSLKIIAHIKIYVYLAGLQLVRILD